MNDDGEVPYAYYIIAEDYVEKVFHPEYLLEQEQSTKKQTAMHVTADEHGKLTSKLHLQEQPMVLQPSPQQKRMTDRRE